MPFSERFSTLITICRVKNAAISRGINCDPSLISRWRTGDRIPVHVENTAAALGRYFATLPILKKDREQLLDLLCLEEAGEEKLALAIAAYLNGQLPPLREEPPAAPEAKTEESAPKLKIESTPEPAPEEADSKEILCTFSEFLSLPESSEPRGVSFFPYVRKGVAAEHERFSGREGLRRACYSFFHAVLSSTKPLEVYFLNAVEPLRIKEDPTFSELWSKGLAAMAGKGHRVRVLLPGTQARNLAIDDYLPLLPFSEAEFFSLDADFSLYPSLFLAKGLAAAVCFPGLADLNTLYYPTPSSSEVFSDVLSLCLNRAVPLFSHFPGRGTAFSEALLRFEEREHKLYAHLNALTPLFLEGNAFAALLQETFPGRPLSEPLRIFSKRQESFLRKHEEEEVMCFFPLSALHKFMEDGRLPLVGLGLPGEIALPPPLRKQYLDALPLLFGDSRFSLAFTDEAPVQEMLLSGSAVFLPSPGTALPAPYLLVENPAFLARTERYFSTLRSRFHTEKAREMWWKTIIS